VLDSQALLSPESQLARTAKDAPVLVAVAETAPEDNRSRLSATGCEVLTCPGANHEERLAWLLQELGRRKMTNLLVEGGSQLLGTLFDLGQIDEIHTFIAPKIAGGANSPTPVAGKGIDLIASALVLASPTIEPSGADIYIHGRLRAH
jgi:diaminohydroxyphosphoribosylaminopyrimidine deaminase/5-amino-6-(5-phosphoribosylamino)uracil reductase